MPLDLVDLVASRLELVPVARLPPSNLKDPRYRRLYPPCTCERDHELTLEAIERAQRLPLLLEARAHLEGCYFGSFVLWLIEEWDAHDLELGR